MILTSHINMTIQDIIISSISPIIFMYDRDERLRKSNSSSFSKASPKIVRTTSLSSHNHSLNKEEQMEESSMLERVVQRMPAGDSVWRMCSVEQKRNIPGFKSRLEWTYRPRDIRSLFKFSFTTSFFNQIGTISEGDLIIELEEVTFEMSTDDKIMLQDKIETILNNTIEIMKGRGFVEEWRKQNDYLKNVLLDLGEELKKMSETKKKIPVEKIQQKSINKRQIMYPSPAIFSWNPLGSLCVTQNRFPTMRRPLIGQPSSLTKYFEIGSQDSNAAANTDQEQNIHMSKEGKSTIYDWQIDEQVSMLIFKPQERNNEYFNSRSPVDPDNLLRNEQQKGDEDTIDLGSVSRMPVKLKKAYERYFGGGERPGQLHRYDKLKVYDILSLSRQEEDDIVFLIDRITTRPAGTSSAEVAFQNHLTVYPCLFQGQLDRLRYQILSKMLIKDMANPALTFSAYLRVFVLENCFFANEIQIYFKQQYRILGRMPHPQLYGLGSYCKFDTAKAQLIFMDLLKHFLQRADQFDMIKERGIHARRHSCPMRLSINLVVSDQEKNKFLLGLFPLLIVKDREMERFQFKKIKKIVSANARGTSFIKKMNELVVKMEEGKYAYLKTVVDEFFKFKEDLEEPQLQPQRLFLTHCSSCQKVTRFYELPTREEAEVCVRCKVRSFSELLVDTL